MFRLKLSTNTNNYVSCFIRKGFVIDDLWDSFGVVNGLYVLCSA